MWAGEVAQADTKLQALNRPGSPPLPEGRMPGAADIHTESANNEGHLGIPGWQAGRRRMTAASVTLLTADLD